MKKACIGLKNTGNKTHQGSHTAIFGGGERTVDLFPRTLGVADIKIDIPSHVETVVLMSRKET